MIKFGVGFVAAVSKSRAFGDLLFLSMSTNSFKPDKIKILRRIKYQKSNITSITHNKPGFRGEKTSYVTSN